MPAPHAEAAAPLLPLLGELTTPQEQHATTYGAGWADGYRDGAARAAADHAALVAVEASRISDTAARCAQLLDHLEALVAEGTRLRAAATAAAVADTVEAALALAAAVIGHELRAADAPVRDAATRALAVLPGDGVELRVHPDDVAALGQPAGVVTVVPDASVEPGGCVARRGSVTVDAQVRTALARVTAALRGDGSAA